MSPLACSVPRFERQVNLLVIPKLQDQDVRKRDRCQPSDSGPLQETVGTTEEAPHDDRDDLPPSITAVVSQHCAGRGEGEVEESDQVETGRRGQKVVEEGVGRRDRNAGAQKPRQEVANVEGSHRRTRTAARRGARNVIRARMPASAISAHIGSVGTAVALPLLPPPPPAAAICSAVKPASSRLDSVKPATSLDLSVAYAHTPDDLRERRSTFTSRGFLQKSGE